MFTFIPVFPRKYLGENNFLFVFCLNVHEIKKGLRKFFHLKYGEHGDGKAVEIS